METDMMADLVSDISTCASLTTWCLLQALAERAGGVGPALWVAVVPRQRCDILLGFILLTACFITNKGSLWSFPSQPQDVCV